MIPTTNGDTTHKSIRKLSIYCIRKFARTENMKVKYKWQTINSTDRIIHEFFLMNEIEKQHWFSVVHLRLWKSVGLICTQ